MRRAIPIVLVLTLLAAPAYAQDHSLFELGVDGSFSYRFTSPSQTILNLPVSRFRAGVFLSPQLAIEPSASVSSSNSSGIRFTSMTTGLALLYQFSPSRLTAQPYVRPFVEYTRSSSSVNGQANSQSTAAIGAGLGLKIPLSNRLMWRLEGAYANQVGDSRVAALVGLSFFTR